MGANYKVKKNERGKRTFTVLNKSPESFPSKGETDVVLHIAGESIECASIAEAKDLAYKFYVRLNADFDVLVAKRFTDESCRARNLEYQVFYTLDGQRLGFLGACGRRKVNRYVGKGQCGIPYLGKKSSTETPA
jgi:uncharacterized protein with ATP-grasp and redox domains